MIIALRADKDVEDVARAVREHLDPDRVVCCSCGEGFVAASKLATAFDGAEVAPSPAAAYTAAMALTEAGCVRARHRAARRRYISKASRAGVGPAQRRPDA